MDYKKLADLIYPNVTKTPDYWEKKYPERNLANGQEITRFAPSPTGYLHIGNFFSATLEYYIAKYSNGTFYFRLEDTDQKREVENADIIALSILKEYNQYPDEGFTINRTHNGMYGPYRQSERIEIYQTYAKKLVSEGKAFPCFCERTENKEEIFEKREQALRESNTIEEKDPCRDLTLEQVEGFLKQGKPYCIRLKSNGQEGDKVKVFDVIRGEKEIGANCKDVVIIKRDGIPPYAFAHPVDDHLMRTTLVVRGEEWISTWPQHVEIFNALGFKTLKYLHNPLICKTDVETGNKRKLSKRKDPEADMRFYRQKGIPTQSVKEYLLNLINSNFESWRTNNPDKDISEFPFSISKIGTTSPMFDMVKLGDYSKTIISKMTAENVYNELVVWAKEYDNDFYKVISLNPTYSKSVLNIDRETKKPRKDISCWAEVKDVWGFMFDEYFTKNFELENVNIENMKQVLKEYLKIYNQSDDKETWFNRIKEMSDKLGYATDNKLYKENPTAFKGNTATICEYIRIALTTHKNSPDLYEICKVLGKDKVLKRINDFIK